MKTNNFINFFLGTILFCSLTAPCHSLGYNTASFSKNGHTIDLEVVDTESQREKGLMYRTSMPKNHGMYFIFEKPDMLYFWMKNTLIPLDMIFLNNNKVVAIFNDVPPCKKETAQCPSYGPKVKADAVIELNAGTAKKLKLTKSDSIALLQP